METKQKKIGRPTIGKQAMTNAERQKRWRERIKQEAVSLLRQLQESNKNVN